MTLWLLCGALAIALAAALIKLCLLHKSLDDLVQALGARMEADTNNLLFVSSRDRWLRRLAAELNRQLGRLRAQRRRYQNGDRELKEAVTNISHDLRTPLTAICGYLDLLEGEDLSPDAARYLACVAERSQALKRLTEELFRYSMAASAPEELRLEPVCVNQVLEESIAAFYGALRERGIVPVLRIPEARVVRRVDRGALSRVFGNLLSNALKYSGGDLEIALLESGETIFSNSAPGLDGVQVGRLFDRFFSVEAASNATGLGLAIARTLVERMNGSITARYEGETLSLRVSFPEAYSQHP